MTRSIRVVQHDVLKEMASEVSKMINEAVERQVVVEDL